MEEQKEKEEKEQEEQEEDNEEEQNEEEQEEEIEAEQEEKEANCAHKIGGEVPILMPKIARWEKSYCLLRALQGTRGRIRSERSGILLTNVRVFSFSFHIYTFSPLPPLFFLLIYFQRGPKIV